MMHRLAIEVMYIRFITTFTPFYLKEISQQLIEYKD